MKGRVAAEVGAVLIAIAIVAVGCGRRDQRAASGGAAVVAQADGGSKLEPVGAVAVEPSPAATPTETAGLGESLAAAASADSLPPDLVASIKEEPVRPGEVIEITVDGSPDVVEITLSDGIRTTQPLVYDSAATLWRIFYRVPMGTTADRIGLSLTAKNAHNRWRRIWVFPTIQGREAQRDSTSGS